jgi:hypothetical protein
MINLTSFYRRRAKRVADRKTGKKLTIKLFQSKNADDRLRLFWLLLSLLEGRVFE